MKRNQLLKLLASHGYYVKRITGHIILTNGKQVISVPNHKEVKSWTVAQISRSIGLKLVA